MKVMEMKKINQKKIVIIKKTEIEKLDEKTKMQLEI
jgi:hypothetical protein